MTGTAPEPISYSVEGAAAAVGVHPDTIRAARNTKDLPVRYSGTKVLILATDLRRWVESLPTERKSS